jgi:hypothetical protein
VNWFSAQISIKKKGHKPEKCNPIAGSSCSPRPSAREDFNQTAAGPAENKGKSVTVRINLTTVKGGRRLNIPRTVRNEKSQRRNGANHRQRWMAGRGEKFYSPQIRETSIKMTDTKSERKISVYKGIK